MGKMKTAVSFLQYASDKDYLLHKTLVKLLNLLIGPSMYFLVKSRVSKRPC